MKFLILSSFLTSLLLSVTAVAVDEEPSGHRHESSGRTHVHFLPNSEAEIPHSHSSQDKVDSDELLSSHVMIVTKNIMAYERLARSYVKYESEAGNIFLQLMFRSKNLETDKTVLGVAEVPIDSCDNALSAEVYLAYDGLNKGEWYAFKRDETALPIPLAFVNHLCELSLKQPLSVEKG